MEDGVKWIQFDSIRKDMNVSTGKGKPLEVRIPKGGRHSSCTFGELVVGAVFEYGNCLYFKSAAYSDSQFDYNCVALCRLDEKRLSEKDRRDRLVEETDVIPRPEVYLTWERGIYG